MQQSGPRCHACGEKVSATATWCMHCEADLDGDGGGATADPDGADDYDPTASATGRADEDESLLDATDVTEATSVGSGAPTEPAGTGLLDTDGLADDSLTVLVGLVGGAVAGLLALVVALFTLQSAWGFLGGLVVWLGVTARLVRRRTVFDALKEGCYATAALLVCVPVIALGPGAEGGTFGGQVLLFLIAEIPFGAGALVVTGLGFWLGKKAPGEG